MLKKICILMGNSLPLKMGTCATIPGYTLRTSEYSKQNTKLCKF